MVAVGLLLALVALTRAQAEPLIYTGIWAEIPPEIRAGRAFIPLRAVCEALGATVQWMPRDGTVSIRRTDSPEIRFTPASPIARIGGNACRLAAAPYMRGGRIMAPMRFLAEKFGVPVIYHAATRTIRLPVGPRLYILPLLAHRGGIIFETPAPGVTVGNPILLQGVANVYEGEFEVEILLDGQRISHSYVRASMGELYPFSTRLYYNNTRGDTSEATIVGKAWGGREDEDPETTILKVRLSPTE